LQILLTVIRVQIIVFSFSVIKRMSDWLSDAACGQWGLFVHHVVCDWQSDRSGSGSMLRDALTSFMLGRLHRQWWDALLVMACGRSPSLPVLGRSAVFPQFGG
jgi:hypothetical protein